MGRVERSIRRGAGCLWTSERRAVLPWSAGFSAGRLAVRRAGLLVSSSGWRSIVTVWLLARPVIPSHPRPTAGASSVLPRPSVGHQDLLPALPGPAIRHLWSLTDSPSLSDQRRPVTDRVRPPPRSGPPHHFAAATPAVYSLRKEL